MNQLPTEVVLKFGQYLHSRRDYANFCLANRKTGELCWMTKNERRAFLTRVLTKEAWYFDRAEKWMIEHAQEKPIFTISLFEVVLSQRPLKAITLSQELVAIYEKNSQQDDAIAIQRAIWLSFTRQGVSPTAVEPGLRLAAMYEKNGQQENGIAILKAIWLSFTRQVVSPTAVEPGLRLAAMYEKNGQQENGIAIRKAISLRYINPIPCLPTMTILTPTSQCSLQRKPP
jgi:hypothetical protein